MQTLIINFTIPKKLLTALDRQAKSEVKTRSELLRDAVRLYISQRQRWESLFQYGEGQAKKLGIKENQVEKLIDDYRQGK